MALVLLQIALLGASTAAARNMEAAQEQIERGFDLLKRQRTDDAVKAFRRADKLSGGTSAEAATGLSLAYGRVKAYKSAESAARRAIELTEDPVLQGWAHTALGIAIFYRAGDDRVRLEEAEAAFRKAIELGSDDLETVKYNLGEVLLKLGRDEEGLDFLEEYLRTEPGGPAAARAASLVDDPRRARENLAPDFGLVTFDGEYLTPDELRGKVVLLYFWATWCGPCRSATPQLRKLNNRLRDGPFVMIGVSADRDIQTLERYVSENEMDWAQVWDERGKVARDSFRVRSYPTFVVIDHESRLALRQTGWTTRTGAIIGQELRRCIRKASAGETG